MRELERMFDVFENTMSLHLRENLPPKVKHGAPGHWRLDLINDEPIDRDFLEDLASEIIETAHDEPNAFVEDDQELVQVVQLRNYRIVITIPPFSDAYEITVVRPTMQRSLGQYHLPKMLIDRLEERAEGILIAGPPGHGKSTFAAALTNFYADQNKIIKTIEKPRDLQLDDRITQFTTLPEDVEKLADVLLLMRPDYVIFDEIRKNLDFNVYTDMRLAGVGMVGVIHGTKPIDAIQRFVNRIELGLIPSVIDTVLFIKDGELESVLSLKMTVKTPSGFNDEGLARPVIEVNDFLDKKPLYEMFSFGEQIIVVPLSESRPRSSGRGKRGRNDDNYERKKRTVKKQPSYQDMREAYSYRDENNHTTVLEIIETRKELILKVGEDLMNESVQLMIGPQVIMNAIVDHNGEVKLSRKKAATKRLERLIETADAPLTVRLN